MVLKLIGIYGFVVVFNRTVTFDQWNYYFISEIDSRCS